MLIHYHEKIIEVNGNTFEKHGCKVEKLIDYYGKVGGYRIILPRGIGEGEIFANCYLHEGNLKKGIMRFMEHKNIV